MARDYVYYVELNEDEVLQSLKNIEASMNRMSDAGEKAFKKIQDKADSSDKKTSKFRGQIRQAGFALQRFGVQGVATWGEIFAAAGPAGLAIGAVLVPTIALTKAFQTLAKEAVDAFKDLIKGSVETGREFQATRAQFTGIFDGAVPIAEAAFKRIRDLSEQLGTDATEISRAFLPEVESLNQLEQIVKLASALAKFQPEQGALGARIALQEGLSGDLRSLQRRFEISPEAIDRIRELQKELGSTQGLIVGLGDELKRTGRDLETLGSTFDVSLGRIQELLKTLLGVAGEPIVDALTEQATRLFETLDEHRDDLTIIMNSLGEALAGVIDLLGDKLIPLLDSLDSQRAIEIADAIRQIGAGIELIIKVAPGLDSASGTMNSIEFSARAVADALGMIATALVLVESVGTYALQALYQKFGPILAAVAYLSGDLEKAAYISSQLATTPLEDATRVFAEGAQAILEYKNGLAGIHDENVQFAEDLSISTDAAENLADATLGAKKAASDLAAAEDALAQKTAEINEEQKKLADELTQDLMEAELKRNRALLDLEQDTAEKRVDAARDHVRKIQKIYRDYQNDIADAATDLSRDEEDIARKSAREQEDVDRESAKKKLEIEKDFRDKLDEIRRKFLFDAEEAVRQNDAVEFLRIKRRMEFELNEARLRRDSDIQDEQQAAQQKREEQRVALEREVEDAQIANQRKLEDLQTSLARRLQEQSIAYAQELQDIKIQEERKREEINKALARQIEDINRNFQTRLQAIKAGLDAEVKAYQDAAAKMIQAAAEVARARARALSGGIVGGSGVGSSTPGGQQSSRGKGDDKSPVHPVTGRKLGGNVKAGEPVLVGEPLPGNKPNPEVYIPNSSGMVRSLTRLMSSMPSKGAAGSTVIDNSRTIEAPISLNDPTSFSPIQWALIDGRITRMLQQVYKK